MRNEVRPKHPFDTLMANNMPVARIGYSGKSVLICSINYAPEVTGAGRYAGELGQALAERGARVDVIAAPPHYPGWQVFPPYSAHRYRVDRDDTVTIFRCPLLLRRKMNGLWRLLAPLSFMIASLPVLVWRFFRCRPDTVVCVEPTLLMAPAATLMARLFKSRTILHVQDLEVDAAFEVGHLRDGGLLKRLSLVFERQMLGRFDQVVTISDAMKARLQQKGVRKDRLVIVRNWVDLERIFPTEGHNSYRKDLGVSEDTFVVEYAGNMGAKQGLQVVVDAARLLRQREDVLFLLVGEGPERARLVSQCANLPNVRFLSIQPEDRLCELLNAADLHLIPQVAGAADLVLPSKLGGILASGRPLVVTATPDQELARFLGSAATFVDPGDSHALAAAISAHSGCRRDGGRSRRIALAAQLSSKDALERLGRIVFPD